MIPNKSTIAAGLYHAPTPNTLAGVAASTLTSTLASALTASVAVAALALGVDAAFAQAGSSRARTTPARPNVVRGATTRTTPTPTQIPSRVSPVRTIPVEERFSRTVAPGIELTTIARREAVGPVQLFATRINLHPENADVKYQLRLATAEHSVLKSTTVSAMAKRENAVVALNGGYFAFGGAALGAVKINGDWLRLPLKNRTALGIGNGGEVLINNLEASAKATFLVPGPTTGARHQPVSFEVFAVHNLNGFAPENGIAIVTPHFGKSYALRPDEVALEVEGGVVRARVETGKALIRAGGWTLVARGSRRDEMAALAPGQAATWQVQTPSAWRKYSTILGAGPRLLKNGKIETTEAQEEFRPDVLARGPRSALGVDRAGHFWFLAVDGRAGEYSVGLTIPELALEMQKLGCVEAICLDGGGSTAMTVNGILVNRPSDGNERRVPNALVIVGEGTRKASADWR